MSVEQIARDFIARMDDVNAAKSYLAPDAVAAGGVLPQPMPASEAIEYDDCIEDSFPRSEI